MYITWCTVGNKRRGRLVEWVDKTSFDRLNKLFMISTSKRNHETLLIEQNLLKLVRDFKSYASPPFLVFLPECWCFANTTW